MRPSDNSNPTMAPGLTGGERDEVEHRARPRALVIHETIRMEGENELRRRPSALFWSGLAAGLSMGLSIVAMAVLRSALPPAGWTPLIVNLGYCFGFVVVIMGRQQLFTENTLTPVLPLLYNRDAKTLARMLRLWGVVLLANVAGAWMFAALASFTAMLPPHLVRECVDLASEATSATAGVSFVRAIPSGAIVALLVWVLPNAESSRASMIVAFTYLIGAGGFSHVVAGSVDGAFVVLSGTRSALSFFGSYFVPVLAGNVVGGMALVAAIAHAQVIADARRE